MVKGNKAKRDLYVGTCDMMGTAKTSLHPPTSRWPAEVVRIARTSESARLTGAQTSRVLEDFHPPTHDGWRLALQVAVPHSSLVDRPARSGADLGASWWPTPGPQTALVFRVFTTVSDAADATGRYVAAVGRMGAMLLPGGGSVWVMVDAVPTDAKFEDGVAAHRVNAEREHRARGLPLARVFEPVHAWGTVDHVPVLMDLGGFAREAAAGTDESPGLEHKRLKHKRLKHKRLKHKR